MTGKSPQKVLLDSFTSQNIRKFKFALEILKADVNVSYQQCDGLSMFEMVLQTPKMSKFIELCVNHGANLYQQNAMSLYPIHYVIQSLSAFNLNMLLKYSKTFSPDDVEFYSIINFQMPDGKNWLHHLIDNLSEENIDEVAEMMKVLVKIGCNLNLRDDSQETPFNCLVRKANELRVGVELVEYFSHNYVIEEDNRQQVLNNLSLKNGMEDLESPLSVNLLLKLLRNKNEVEFCDKFVRFKLESDNLPDDIASLLEQAILVKSNKVVNFLLKNHPYVILISKLPRFKLTPVLLACRMGFFDILESLLKVQSLKLSDENGETALHFICSSDTMNNDLKACFELIVDDDRCDGHFINQLDSKGFSAVYYSNLNCYDDISLELLRRGSYIGHKSVIETMSETVLETFLDGCLQARREAHDKLREYHINFRFLKPPEKIKVFSTELRPLLEIAENENTQNLILHPVLSSFINIKWTRINVLVYANLFIWFSLMAFLTGFIVIFFQNSVYNQVQQLSNNRSWEFKDNSSALFYATDFLQNKLDDAEKFLKEALGKPKSIKKVTKFYGRNETTHILDETNYETIAMSEDSDERCAVFKAMVEAGDEALRPVESPFKIAFIYCSEALLCCPDLSGTTKLKAENYQFECDEMKSFSDIIGGSECYKNSTTAGYQFFFLSSYAICNLHQNSSEVFHDGCERIIQLYVSIALRQSTTDCPDFEWIHWTFRNLYYNCHSCEDATDFEEFMYGEAELYGCISSDDAMVLEEAFGIMNATCNSNETSTERYEFDYDEESPNRTKRNVENELMDVSESPDSSMQIHPKKQRVELACDADGYIYSITRADNVIESVEHLIDDYKISYNFCLFIVGFLLALELIELAFSFKTYFLSFGNWLDLALVIVSLIVFSNKIVMAPSMFRKVRVSLILLTAAQSIQLVTTISLLSVSFHFTIFKKVSVTFLKSISLYSIMIIAFAMSFFTLFGFEMADGESLGSCVNDSRTNFCNPKFSGLATTSITTLRMMLSDFDSSRIETGTDPFVDLILLLFVFFIAIVLFNLLNALAVTDTQNLRLEAELVDMKKRISVICGYEKFFSILRIKCFDAFPSIIPHANIVLIPKQSREVKTEVPFDVLKGCVIPMETFGKSQYESVLRFNFTSYFKVPVRMDGKSVTEIIKFVAAKENYTTDHN